MTADGITPQTIAQCAKLIRPHIRRTPVIEVDAGEFGLDGQPLALKLEQADKAFQAATRDFKKCIWGKGTARKEKWTPQKNWWYFRTPLSSNGQLEDELATIR